MLRPLNEAILFQIYIAERAFVIPSFDLRALYDSSYIGRSLIFINTGLIVASVIFIIKLNAAFNLHEYLFYLASEVVIWNYIFSVIVDVCNSPVASSHI